MVVELSEESTWLIGRISEKLTSRHMFLGTAESCTGGLASVLCTNVPGSSAWFCGSIVSYSNTIKTRLLGVESSIIEEYGAVSRPVAEAMAKGAVTTLGAEISLAITGIAGPAGGTPEKPVGTVWIATALKRGSEMEIVSFVRQFHGDRNDIRFGAALSALGAVDAALNDGINS